MHRERDTMNRVRKRKPPPIVAARDSKALKKAADPRHATASEEPVTESASLTVPALESVGRVAAFPDEGIAVTREFDDDLYRGYFMLQLLKIPEAYADWEECRKEFIRGPGKEYRRLVHIARVYAGTRAHTIPGWKRKMASVGKKMAPYADSSNDEGFQAQITAVFNPFVDKWCLSSDSMIDWLHYNCAFDLCFYECNTRSYQRRFRFSKRARARYVASLVDNNRRPTRQWIKFIAQLMQDEYGIECGRHWEMVLSPEWLTVQRISGRQPETGYTRDERRAARAKLGVRLIKEYTVATGAWLFVMTKVMGMRFNELMDAIEDEKIAPPYPEVDLRNANRRHVWTYYVLPFHRALGLEVRPGRPDGYKPLIRHAEPDWEINDGYAFDINVFLGGRAAEEAKYGPRTDRIASAPTSRKQATD